jgi:RNA polymerase sigma-70 factor, ECF subfamily
VAYASNDDVTLLLSQLSEGDQSVIPRLIPVVYDELRHLAASHMRYERPDHTLRTTALVHEAYIRLVEQRQVNWKSRAHFFGIAAQLMRRILVDHARNHLRKKRGGEQQKLSLDEAATVSLGRSAEVVAVDEALGRLAKLDPRQNQIVELRFFGGLSTEETAEVLGVSARTVEREWSLAKAWLYMEFQEGHGNQR